MVELIKALRLETGASVADCKTALVSAKGDMGAARKELSAQGHKAVTKFAGRTATVTVVGSYVHHNGSIGALAKLATQTDFVARTDEVKELAKDIAMQVAATGTITQALLDESWVKNPAMTIRDRVAQVSAKVGEKVVVRKVVRL